MVHVSHFRGGFPTQHTDTSADIVLCPTLNVLPPPPGALTLRGSVDAFFDVEFASTGATAVANATGWPASTLPLGEVDGLPVGVQMMATRSSSSTGRALRRGLPALA